MSFVCCLIGTYLMLGNKPYNRMKFSSRTLIKLWLIIIGLLYVTTAERFFVWMKSDPFRCDWFIMCNVPMSFFRWDWNMTNYVQRVFLLGMPNCDRSPAQVLCRMCKKGPNRANKEWVGRLGTCVFLISSLVGQRREMVESEIFGSRVWLAKKWKKKTVTCNI